MDKIYDSLVRVGLSSTPREVPLFTDEPKFYNCFTVPNEDAGRRYNVEDIYGQGFDSNRETSKVKSVGEMLERLCLSNPQENFIVSHFIENGDFIRPSLFFCYSREQTSNINEKKRELDKGEYRWIKAKKMSGGQVVYVPAQMVFLSKKFSDEYALRKEQISTGAAFGKIGTRRAFKTGFLESVERDAIMSFYLKRIEGRKMFDFSEEISELLDYLRRYQLETHVFDVTTDLEIPSVLALTLDYTGLGEAVNVGSSSDLSYGKAVKKAITESIQCRRIGRSSKKFLQAKPIDESEINSLEDRLIYWRDLDRIENVRHLIEERPHLSFQSLTRKQISLRQAVNNVLSRNFNILVVDINLPEIRKQGFETLKVVIPELHPLYLDERAKALYSVHHGEIKNDSMLKPHPVT
ncbi:MAG TPA: YcaO-like family protein [Candidatus Nanoarchaeia archaeon]|nr:YcaO-like family protein [Candidatus Nanoarchaeia archaeon]